MSDILKDQTEYLYTYKNPNYMDLKNPEIRQAKKELLKEAYSTAKRCQEIISFVLVVLLLPFAFLHLFQTLSFFMLVPMITGIIGGLLFSDFVSGFVHWGADTWGNLEWPIVGKSFIRSFREHHVAPSAMCNHDFIETNGDNFMLVIPTLFTLCRTDIMRNASNSGDPYWGDVFSYTLWLSISIGVAMTNQFHKWSHTHKPPTVVVWLQKSRIILSKENHSVHHRPAFDGYYCITTGWLNPILERIRFWRGLENVVMSCTGLVPREDDDKWTGLVEDTPDIVKKFITLRRRDHAN